MFANSDTNFVLLQTIFPSVSTIINGIGEYIKLFFAAEFTFNVRSCKCWLISLFLLLFAKYVYPKIAINIIIAGIINFGFSMHIAVNKINIITRYIFVLDTKLSNNFLLLLCKLISPLFSNSYILPQFIWFVKSPWLYAHLWYNLHIT